MKILHISDLHKTPGKANSFAQAAFFNDIVDTLKDSHFDLCVFSGDLVHKGRGSYRDAYNWLYEELVSRLSVNKLLIACGNHDVNRNMVTPMFADYLETRSANDLLDAFVLDDESKQFSSNLAHVNAYNDVVSEMLRPVHVSPLYYVDKMESDGKKIGLVSLNTAWSAVGRGKDNYGSLLFPKALIYEALDKVKDCEFKIVCTHFPTAYLREFNRIEIESLLNKHFDCCFVGHAHRISKGINFVSNQGILSCMAPAVLSTNSPDAPGFLLLDIDLADYEVGISGGRYLDGNILMEQTITIDLPVEKAKRDAITIKKAVSNRHAAVSRDAARLLLPYGHGEADFASLFTEPVLKRSEHLREITRLDAEDTRMNHDPNIPTSSLMSGKNFIVFGNEKSGKTVLMMKLYLDCLKDFDYTLSLPLYIDLKPYYRSTNQSAGFDLKNLLRKEYNLSSRLADIALSSFKIMLLIDNLNPNFKDINLLLVETIQAGSNVRFIATGNLVPETAVPREFSDLVYTELHIRDISRKEIRTLARKWPSLQRYDINEVIEKLTAIFTQLSIHFNYWTVSLFLWIFEKTSTVDINNNVELIHLYIESVLDRPNLARGSATLFSFENYKDFLAELAFDMYRSGAGDSYSLTYSEVIACFERFKDQNIRIVASAKEVIDYLLEKSVLIGVSGDRYTFRLNGVFEYFLAHHMLRSPAFRNQVLDEELLYLSFTNELEIYAGLVRSDPDLLVAMYINTLEAAETYYSRFPDRSHIDIKANMDAQLLEELAVMDEEMVAKVRPLGIEEKDEFEDALQPIVDVQSEVKLKPHYSLAGGIDTDLLGRHLVLLSRVFRSMDAIHDKDLVQEIFRYIVRQGCLLPFYIIQDLERENSDEAEARAMRELFSNAAPIISHTILQYAVGHRNLEKLVMQEIQAVPDGSSDDNLYKLFVLYFLVIENDIGSNLNLIDRLIELCARNPLIGRCLVLKLTAYVVFNCESKKLETELKRRILEAYRLSNPKDRSNRIVQNVDRLKIKHGAAVDEAGD